jgi:hypothetical protein
VPEDASTEYWVSILDGGAVAGAGFFITSRLVLTAKHVVGDRADAVALALPDGRRLTGRILERAAASDLALIEVGQSDTGWVLPPQADRCHRGELWRTPYRPSQADPPLAGTVLATDVDYECEGGEVVRALHLITSLSLGTYLGYSGGPVERYDGLAPDALIGLLLEQYPDRHTPARSSNVLIAIVIGHALTSLRFFDIGHLLAALTGNAGAPRDTADDVKETLAKGESLLEAVEQWAKRGLVDVGEVRQMQARIVERVIDRSLS